MRALALEVRDRMTFIPVLAVSMVASNEGQLFLLRSLGYTLEEPRILLTRLAGGQSASDPYSWDNRTMRTAHGYIFEHWNDLSDGDVIDVEHILGETSTQKRSERHDA